MLLQSTATHMRVSTTKGPNLQPERYPPLTALPVQVHARTKPQTQKTHGCHQPSRQPPNNHWAFVCLVYHVHDMRRFHPCRVDVPLHFYSHTTAPSRSF